MPEELSELTLDDIAGMVIENMRDIIEEAEAFDILHFTMKRIYSTDEADIDLAFDTGLRMAVAALAMEARADG